MAERKRRIVSLAITMGLLALNLAALNYLLADWSTARVDLTQENVFSISPATRRILGTLDENLTIHAYFSKRTHPKLAPLIPAIEDLLDEFRAISGGKVDLEILDPGENEEAEQEASDRFGVRSTPFRLATKYESAIVNAYFALVVQYGDQYVRYGFEDLIQVDPAPDGDVDVRLRNLEYDLTRAIKKVVYGFRSTHELFERIDQPVKLIAIWTPVSLPEMFAGVPDAVRKAADELKKAGGERFTFEEVDPAGREDVQQQLHERYGAQPMSLGLLDDRTFYLYALLQVGDKLEQVPLALESITSASVREAVENSLRRHSPGFLKTVGIAAPATDQIPPQLRMQLQMPPAEPPEFEDVKQFLGQDYRTLDVDLAGATGVPSEVDVLLVLKPKNLGEKEVYNLDQYLMRGGRVIVCAGNYDVDFGSEGLSLAPIDTGIESWLEHFGLAVGKTLVLDDRNQALPIPQVRQTPFGLVRTWEMAPYPYLVQVREDGLMNPDITAKLEAVGIYWGSPLTVAKEKTEGLDVIPLLQSSSRSWTSDDLSRASVIDYEVPTDSQPQLLAVALSGRFKSYFAGKEAPAGGGTGPPLVESPETRLVVVGNSEFLSDFVARALARVDGGFFLENLRFAQNMLDWVSLDNEMLEIRSRGLASRRLARIDDTKKMTVEIVNYAAPVLILFTIGALLRWRRRRTTPLASLPSREQPEAAS